MKTKVKFAGVVVIEVGGRKYMCGTTTDGGFAHNYIPDGKTREVTCAHTTAEACYEHEKALGTTPTSRCPTKSRRFSTGQ